MADYLLHSLPNGKPVGVFSETESYYDPKFNAERAQRAVDLVRSKPDARSWQDWADSLASRNPTSPDIMTWDLFPHRRATLRRVLRDAQNRIESALS